MKNTFVIKRTFPLAIASALLASSMLVPVAHAQKHKPKVPVKPIDIQKRPIDPTKKPAPALPPTIQSPSNNAHVTTPTVVKGVAQSGSKVHVTTKVNWEQIIDGKSRRFTGKLGSATAVVNSDNKWSTTPIKLEAPKDAKQHNFEISAVQIYADGRKSAASVIVVKPALKIAPLRPMANVVMMSYVQITSHREGDKISRKLKQITLQGKASSERVSVRIGYTVKHPRGRATGSSQGYTAEVKNGKWSIDLRLPTSKGDDIIYTLLVETNDGNGAKDVATRMNLKGY